MLWKRLMIIIITITIIILIVTIVMKRNWKTDSCECGIVFFWASNCLKFWTLRNINSFAYRFTKLFLKRLYIQVFYQEEEEVNWDSLFGSHYFFFLCLMCTIKGKFLMRLSNYATIPSTLLATLIFKIFSLNNKFK